MVVATVSLDRFFVSRMMHSLVAVQVVRVGPVFVGHRQCKKSSGSSRWNDTHQMPHDFDWLSASVDFTEAVQILVTKCSRITPQPMEVLSLVARPNCAGMVSVEIGRAHV